MTGTGATLIPASRNGKMLRTRVLTALAMLAIFLCVLFLLPRPFAAAAFALIAGLAAWEWAGLIGAKEALRIGFAALIVASAFVLMGRSDTAFPLLWTVAALFWLAVTPFWLWRRWRLAGHALIAYVVGWLLIVPTWAAMVALRDRNPWLLFAAMALVWVADIGAYFTGRAVGRTKLAPAISPGKTWEGVGGAVVATLVYGLLAALVAGVPVAANLAWALFLLLLTAISIVGDLFESMIKRQAGAKDSSNLLPGHGGILDRIDSQTSTLPLVALAIHLGSR
jgi:phosphatidate cytidylyltransferase